MKLYLDICALKRPWDDQEQPRIAAETALIISIVQLTQNGIHEAVRSPIHDEENARNRDPLRAAAIAEWLASIPLPTSEPAGLRLRARSLVRAGLGPFDALHLSWAEALAADLLITTDQAFIRRASRTSASARIAVTTPGKAMEALETEHSP